MNPTQRCAPLLALLFACVSQAAFGQAFTVSYLDGSSWNTVYGQGFSPSVSPTPNPGLAAGSTVYLSAFNFFKSGNADTAADVRLAIINNIFGDLTNLSTASPLFVGLSTNTIPTTAPLATGAPIPFAFANLPLTYGNNYAAIFVNLGAGGALTPVRVSSLTANYTETPPGSGSFHPATNYGTETQFTYATGNFLTVNSFGTFLSTFSFAGDANFAATFTGLVPEPTSSVLAIGGVACLAARRRRGRNQ